MDEHRLWRFAVVAALAMLTGELVGLTVAGLGVWYAMRYGRRRVGAAIGCAGAAWTILCLVAVIPAFNDGKSSPFYGRFESVGGSPTGLITTLFSDPGDVVAALTTAADGWYVVWLLIPTALVALAEPLLLVAAAPQLVINLMSDWVPSTQPTYQYVTPIVPILIAATVVGMRRFTQRVRPVAAAAVLVAALACFLWKPPIPGDDGYEAYLFSPRESSARVAAMRAAIDLVPTDAVVTATNRLGAHLSERRAIHLFPHRSSSKWIAIDTHDPFVAKGGEERLDAGFFSRQLAYLEGDVRWVKVLDRAGVRVYRRAT
jgi:hypothetical protein